LSAQELLKVEMEKVLPKKVYYDVLEDTHLGAVWLATRGNTLVAISYEDSEEDFRQFLGKLLEGRFERSSSDVAWAKEDVRDYLMHKLDLFNLRVDLSSITDFQRQVLNETIKIPRGHIRTYGEIAKQIGNPKAVRAVGQALRRNPIPIVVPCHRVVASNGLGGYSGKMGDMRKVHLLKLEGVVFA
jgi:methylated-DNA-[protein]-cysteine S-methyltransferase